MLDDKSKLPVPSPLVVLTEKTALDQGVEGRPTVAPPVILSSLKAAGEKVGASS